LVEWYSLDEIIYGMRDNLSISFYFIQHSCYTNIYLCCLQVTPLFKTIKYQEEISFKTLIVLEKGEEGSISKGENFKGGRDWIRI
jgi:hypothetical protein